MRQKDRLLEACLGYRMTSSPGWPRVSEGKKWKGTLRCTGVHNMLEACIQSSLQAEDKTWSCASRKEERKSSYSKVQKLDGSDLP